MKIDILVCDNPYDSAAYFSEKLGEALVWQGAQVRLLPANAHQFAGVLHAIRRDRPDLTCSYSDITFCGLPLGEQLQIPHVSLLIDPAPYYTHLMEGMYSRLTCVDEGDVAFVKSRGFEQVTFVPHGVDPGLEGAKEKVYDIAFFGSVHDFRECQDVDVVEAGACVLAPGGPSCLEAIDLPRFNDLDRYATAKERVDMINALAGFEVHVWGRGPWEELCPHAHVHEAVSFPEALGLMGRSKIVLNSSARFKRGSHERLLHAPLLGAFPLTAKNPFTDQYLPSLPTYTDSPVALAKQFLETPPDFLLALKNAIVHTFSWSQVAKEFLEVHEQQYSLF